MAPSELINVRNFRDKFSSLMRNQNDRGLFAAQEHWSEEDKATVSERCKVVEDLSFSSSAFVNPTLFHMLRQHREFNEAIERDLLRRKDEQAKELERKQREKRDNDELTSNADAELSSQRVPEATDDVGEDEQGGLNTQTQNKASKKDTSSKSRARTRSKARAEKTVADGNNEDEDGKDGDAIHNEEALNDISEQVQDPEGGIVEGSAEQITADDGVEAAPQDDSAETDDHKDQNEESSTLLTMEINSRDMEVDNGTVEDALARLASTTETESPVVNAEVPTDAPVPDAQTTQEPTGQSTSAENQDTTAEIVAAAVAALDGQTPANLPKGITKEIIQQAIANSGFERSTSIGDTSGENGTRLNKSRRAREGIEDNAGMSELEVKFRRVANMLDESTLSTLREVNRRMVPNRHRLEVNFMTNRKAPEIPANATPVADDEVILSVCIFNPRTPTAKMEEYLVLGSQNLTVLRDAFYCLSDFLVSSRDEHNVNTKEKKVSSSYFYIEKTFYNDMRSPQAIDYSRVIMEWANAPGRAERNPHLAGLQSRMMDGARFLDLAIRLKHPYLFVHQGNCEHVLMFTDLRLLSPSDDQYVDCYPKQVFRTRHMRHKCRMCSAYPAQYVTKNDFNSGMSPCYFCEKCYTPFHYDVDGNLLLEHEVYPYANVNIS